MSNDNESKNNDSTCEFDCTCSCRRNSLFTVVTGIIILVVLRLVLVDYNNTTSIISDYISTSLHNKKEHHQLQQQQQQQRQRRLNSPLDISSQNINVENNKNKNKNSNNNIIINNNLPTAMTANELMKIEKSIENNVENNNSIKKYLQNMKCLSEQMIVLKYNMNGTLINYTKVTIENHYDWIEPFLSSDYMYTNPSPYGKVSLIYVTDAIRFIPWTINPPIPLLVYTIKKDYYTNNTTNLNIIAGSNSLTNKTISSTTSTTTNTNTKNNNNNYYLIPDPYDERGFSEYNVDRLYEKYGSTMTNTSYNTFHNRNNTLIWRGANHNEPIRTVLVQYMTKLQQQSQQQQQQQQQLTNTNNTHQLWLDAQFSFAQDTNSLSEEVLAGQYKYHLDVGGVSGTSWEGLRWKMCSGNLVFRIQTDSMDWWHTYIQPNIHYIEINHDLSNLQQQYEWVETHPKEAYTIAQSGQQVCIQTFQRTYASTVAKSIIHTLPDSTIKQIQDADEFIEEYYSKITTTKTSATITHLPSSN